MCAKPKIQNVDLITRGKKIIKELISRGEEVQKKSISVTFGRFFEGIGYQTIRA